ncbi:MAG: response regulator transcription factor [Planctomycetota bacterium]
MTHPSFEKELPESFTCHDPLSSTRPARAAPHLDLASQPPASSVSPPRHGNPPPPTTHEPAFSGVVHRVDKANGEFTGQVSDPPAEAAIPDAGSEPHASMPIVRVALFHPAELVSAGLLHAWGKLDAIEITSFSNDPAQLTRALIRTPADIAITSLEHCVDGIAILEALRFTFPELPVLLLCQDESPQSSKRWLEAGAAGFVSQSASLDQLTSIVQWVAQGRLVSSLSKVGVEEDRNKMNASAAFPQPRPTEFPIVKTGADTRFTRKCPKCFRLLPASSSAPAEASVVAKSPQEPDFNGSDGSLRRESGTPVCAPNKPGPSSRDLDREAPALSSREQEVLNGLSLGMTNQQIADSLFLSVKTVETYRSRLRRKLRVDDRAGMVRFARQLEGQLSE